MEENLDDLLAQKQALETKIEQARAAARAEDLALVRKLIERHGLTVGEVFPGHRAPRSARSSAETEAAPKYRDPRTGKTWSGRGRAPSWLQGKNKDDFLIRTPPTE